MHTPDLDAIVRFARMLTMNAEMAADGQIPPGTDPEDARLIREFVRQKEEVLRRDLAA